jgi:hypothetical protein
MERVEISLVTCTTRVEPSHTRASCANCYLLMDPTREDVLRISVDTVHDWNRIKRNYSEAALILLDETLASGGNLHLKHIILPHLNQVSCCSL